MICSMSPESFLKGGGFRYQYHIKFNTTSSSIPYRVPICCFPQENAALLKMIEDLTEDQDEDVAGNALGIQFVLKMCGDDGSSSEGRSLSLSLSFSLPLSPPSLIVY